MQSLLERRQWRASFPGRVLALIGLQALGLSAVAAAWISMAVVLVARLLAMAFRISLPTYSERK